MFLIWRPGKRTGRVWIWILWWPWLWNYWYWLRSRVWLCLFGWWGTETVLFKVWPKACSLSFSTRPSRRRISPFNTTFSSFSRYKSLQKLQMMLFGQLPLGKCFSKWLLIVYVRAKNLPPLEEFHLDLHGSGNIYFWLIDLHGVCIKFIKLVPNVLKCSLL